MKKSKIFIAIGLGILAVLMVVFAILSAVLPVFDREVSAAQVDDPDQTDTVTASDVIGAWVFNDPSTWVASTSAYDNSSFFFSAYDSSGIFYRFHGLHFDTTVGLQFYTSFTLRTPVWSPVDDNARFWSSLCISFTSADLAFIDGSESSVGLVGLHSFLTTVATRITADPVGEDDFALVRFYNDSTLIRTCGYLVGFNIPSYFVPAAPAGPDGYSFVGWSNGQPTDPPVAVNPSAVAVPVAGVSFYAAFVPPAPSSFTVTFHLQGGTLSSGSLTQTVDSGGYAVAPSVSRLYYNLSGWSVSPSGGVVDVSSFAITNNTDFYAIWSAAVSVDDVVGTWVFDQSFSGVSAFDFSSAPSGFRFRSYAGSDFSARPMLDLYSGIFYQSNVGLRFVSRTGGSVPVYSDQSGWQDPFARYVLFDPTSLSYLSVGELGTLRSFLISAADRVSTVFNNSSFVIVTFIAGYGADGLFPDGSGINYSLTIYDQPLLSDLIPDSPAADHYDFVGWFTSAEGGSQVDLDDYVFDTDTTLYGQWLLSSDSVTITFSANGGSFLDGSSAITSYTVIASRGQVLPSDLWPPEISRPGYTFNAWRTPGGVKIDLTSYVFTGSSYALYADWIVEGSSEGDGQFVNPILIFLNPIQTFMDTELFGEISIGDILMSLIFVAVALIFIRMFAGG